MSVSDTVLQRDAAIDKDGPSSTSTFIQPDDRPVNDIGGLGSPERPPRAPRPAPAALRTPVRPIRRRGGLLPFQSPIATISFGTFRSPHREPQFNGGNPVDTSFSFPPDFALSKPATRRLFN